MKLALEEETSHWVVLKKNDEDEYNDEDDRDDDDEDDDWEARGSRDFGEAEAVEVDTVDDEEEEEEERVDEEEEEASILDAGKDSVGEEARW